MIVRGPFELQWGGDTITDVEDIKIEQTTDTANYQTLEGRDIELNGALKATATITLLASDIPALARLLPQYFVANGGVLSTGETVHHAEGAIDITPHACDEADIVRNLDIISCANPGVVYRIVSARTKYEGIEIDGKVQKVMIEFIGQADADEATAQFFRAGTIVAVS